MSSQLNVQQMRGNASIDAAKTTLTRSLHAGLLQRKCACGTQSHGNAECSGCAKKHHALRRKAEGCAAPRIAPSIVHDALHSPGRSLDADTRMFMESRFGEDFSRVRIHTDLLAHRSTRAIGAMAYTAGDDVVFAAGKYSPVSTEGRQLLAHELAHVVQQKGSSPQSRLEVGTENTQAEREADSVAQAVTSGTSIVAPMSAGRHVQRKLAANYSKIKSNLTYGIFDWAINDREARAVLSILQGLPPQDLNDTVEAMQHDGLLDRFFSNLPKKEIGANQDFLRQISRTQIWPDKNEHGQAATRSGSCNPQQMKTVNAASTRASNWINNALTKLDSLRTAPLDPKQKPTADVFKRRFASADSRVMDHVHTVLSGVQRDFQNWNAMTMRCPGDWDMSCHAAGAYANSEGQRGATFCSNYFDSGDEFQTETLVHEFAHIQSGVTHITDRAYTSDRELNFLRPEEALTNAESYALFVEQTGAGRASTYVPRDEHNDCPKPWADALDEATAKTQRSNRNAQVWFDDVTPATVTQRLNAQEQQWLGGKDDKAIEKALKTFDAAEKEFKDEIDFECEPDGGGRCDSAELYWYVRGHLHVCLKWLRLAPDERETRLLAGYYGYIGAGDNASQRDNYARLARSISNRHWAPPTLNNVLNTGTAP